MGLSKKAAKAKEPAVKKSIVQWCKDLHEAGNELKLVWEGGGDSGWVYFEVDGESTDNEYTRALIDRMESTLDYGSWAGEFQANGSAIYDPETNSFEGTDYYGEDDNVGINIDYTITVPKKLWFDTLDVECERHYDDVTNISVRFIMKNGFITNEHSAFCSNLEESLKDYLSDIFDNYESKDDYEFRSCNDTWVLEKANAIEENENLIFKLEQVDIGIITNNEKNIVLELDEETVTTIDQLLNIGEDAE